MKKAVQKFIRKMGGQSHYSGNSRTMYIDDPMRIGIKEEVMREFG